jgi:hypothetical protein
MTTRRIDEIVVGERHRRDLSDIAGLAESITLQYGCALELLPARPVRRAGPRVDAARRHYRRIGNHVMSDDATLMRQLRAVRRAALQAREEAQLAYQFAPNSYTYGALAQIELILVRLAEIEP